MNPGDAPIMDHRPRPQAGYDPLSNPEVPTFITVVG